MIPGPYARLEIRKCKTCVAESLSDHLAAVAKTFIWLYRWFSGIDPPTEAVVAAAVHDIGKLLYNRTRLEKVKLSGEECNRDYSLSFPGHEVLSAAILAAYGMAAGWNPRITAVTVRAVLLHHQGLRGLELGVFKGLLTQVKNELSKLRCNGSKCGLKMLLQDAANVVETVANRLSIIHDSTAKALMDLTHRLPRLAYRVERLLASASTLATIAYVEEAWVEDARIITGLLMIADTGVARLVVEEQTRQHSCVEFRDEMRLPPYPRDSYWLVKAVEKLMEADEAAS